MFAGRQFGCESRTVRLQIRAIGYEVKQCPLQMQWTYDTVLLKSVRRCQDLLCGGVPQQIALRACPHRFEEHLLVVFHTDHQNLRPRRCLMDGACGMKSPVVPFRAKHHNLRIDASSLYVEQW